MTDPKDQNPDFGDLRRRAEEQLSAEASPAQEFSPAEAARMLHELRVHQIELEMQNEELRRAQIQLAESRDQYASLYDFAPVGYLTLDQWSQIIEANLTAASLLKVERSRLLDLYFWIFVAEGERVAFRRLLENVHNSPQRQGEFHLQVGKEVRPMLLNVSFDQDAQGNGIRRLALTDITELKQAQQALEESQKVLSRLNQTLEQQVQERTLELEQATRELESFSYSAAHDLKTPLRTIEGFSRMLLEKHTAGLDAEGRRLLQVVMDNTQQMRNLIDSLLNLARQACQQVRKVPLDLPHMAKGVFLRLQSREPERDLQLITKDSPPAWGDSTLLYQVLMNLLENAFKFSRNNKTTVIEVGGRSEDRENIYYVKDNGMGFNEKDAHKMFMVFQRLNEGKQYEGTGVGLALVQRIIRRHGGRIWVEGKPGKGATFYFTLPRKEE
jgi:PAS domain S-box-containing protein